MRLLVRLMYCEFTLYVTYEGYVIRVPHNPLMPLIGGVFADSRRYIRMN
jgi:hypothetical protein